MSELKACPFCGYEPESRQKCEDLANENATLKAELETLREERRWIPINQPPKNSLGKMYLLADFDSAEKYECGIPATVGYFDPYNERWSIPTGCGVSPTHYKDCITDNETRIGTEH